MGLAERDYMKRTPEELDALYRSTSPSRSNLSSESMLWIVGVTVVMIALPQLLYWLGIGGFAIPIP
jgi:hypothetical protein